MLLLHFTKMRKLEKIMQYSKGTILRLFFFFTIDCFSHIVPSGLNLPLKPRAAQRKKLISGGMQSSSETGEGEGLLVV